MKTLEPILPMPMLLIEEIAPKLDVSSSLLYQIVRKNHKPGPASRRRIQRATGLPDDLWERPGHEISEAIYYWHLDQRQDQRQGVDDIL